MNILVNLALNKKWQRKKKKQQHEKNTLGVSLKTISLLHSWKTEDKNSPQKRLQNSLQNSL